MLAVTVLLASAQAGIGLGLGLFGILSIIRLRSDQLTQEEVAYYFVALALGLDIGSPTGPRLAFAPAVSAVLVAIMYAVDHPRVGARTHRQLVTLSGLTPDRSELHRVLSGCWPPRCATHGSSSRSTWCAMSPWSTSASVPPPIARELRVDSACRHERVAS